MPLQTVNASREFLTPDLNDNSHCQIQADAFSQLHLNCSSLHLPGHHTNPLNIGLLPHLPCVHLFMSHSSLYSELSFITAQDF